MAAIKGFLYTCIHVDFYVYTFADILFRKCMFMYMNLYIHVCVRLTMRCGEQRAGEGRCRAAPPWLARTSRRVLGRVQADPRWASSSHLYLGREPPIPGKTHASSVFPGVGGSQRRQEN